MRKGGRQPETSINGETRGSVSFIKILLVAQGIHPNPGPLPLPKRDEDASPTEPSPTEQSPTNHHHTDRNKIENYQNQQAQRENIDKKIKVIHSRMINDLTAYLRPGDNNEWRNFIALMEGHLGQLNWKDIGHVNDIFKMLEAKGIISCGYYDEIYEELRRIHVGAEKMLRRAAENIRQVKERGQSGHMADVPRHRTMQGTHSVATDDQSIIREIQDKLETVSEAYRRQKDLLQLLSESYIVLAADNKDLKARMVILETKRQTEEQNDEIHTGNSVPNSIGHTKVVKDIPESMDK